MIKSKIPFILLLVLLSCQKKEKDLLFDEMNGRDVGIDFVNRVTDTQELSILDYLYFYNGGGVAVGDIDNDGLTDIYLVSNLLSCVY